MQVKGYICCILVLVAFISITNASGSENNKIAQPFIDSLSSEDSPKDKRPFCNAFTGCGKKRSFSSDNLENRNDNSVRLRLPLPMYRALLRTVGQEIRDSLDSERNVDNAVPEVAVIDDYPSYLVHRMQNPERYQS